MEHSGSHGGRIAALAVLLLLVTISTAKPLPRPMDPDQSAASAPMEPTSPPHGSLSLLGSTGRVPLGSQPGVTTHEAPQTDLISQWRRMGNEVHGSDPNAMNLGAQMPHGPAGSFTLSRDQVQPIAPIGSTGRPRGRPPRVPSMRAVDVPPRAASIHETSAALPTNIPTTAAQHLHASLGTLRGTSPPAHLPVPTNPLYPGGTVLDVRPLQVRPPHTSFISLPPAAARIHGLGQQLHHRLAVQEPASMPNLNPHLDSHHPAGPSSQHEATASQAHVTGIGAFPGGSPFSTPYPGAGSDHQAGPSRPAPHLNQVRQATAHATLEKAKVWRQYHEGMEHRLRHDAKSYSELVKLQGSLSRAGQRSGNWVVQSAANQMAGSAQLMKEMLATQSKLHASLQGTVRGLCAIATTLSRCQPTVRNPQTTPGGPSASTSRVAPEVAADVGRPPPTTGEPPAKRPRGRPRGSRKSQPDGSAFGPLPAKKERPQTPPGL